MPSIVNASAVAAATALSATTAVLQKHEKVTAPQPTREHSKRTCFSQYRKIPGQVAVAEQPSIQPALTKPGETYDDARIAEAITSEHIHKYTHEKWYRVRWVGWATQTWEPASNIKCDMLLHAWAAVCQRRQGAWDLPEAEVAAEPYLPQGDHALHAPRSKAACDSGDQYEEEVGEAVQVCVCVCVSKGSASIACITSLHYL